MPDTTTLSQFPRPSVAVDTAVLCPVPGRGLHVLLTRSRDGRWQLPGSILRPQERLAEAVARCLREKAQLVDRSPVQLHVFDQPDRDDRGWVISVAHLDVLSAADVGLADGDTGTANGDDAASDRPRTKADARGSEHAADSTATGAVEAGATAETAEATVDSPDTAGATAESGRRKLVPVHTVHELSEEHQEIVRVAVHRLRALHERTPDPFGLLPAEFSLRQLRALHEVVAGEEMQADTFRRTMLPLLDATGRAVTQGRGRPAQTFTRRSEIALRQDARGGLDGD
ncbi:NUDIX domain-containing protein [Brevibacterium sp. W7.2]|uniref:NrtR DNA-binding winged helix domain-containing protein n=1 Tax=Brevibacterium sp. W7.2 TaxID=2823518 RepID=UPI0020124905|nr:NUDIX domain-containing protein [Brevibacterium sp. W7.2]